MNGGKEREEGEGSGQLTQVPIGWQRKLETSGVVYISPSGSVLSCLDQVKSYLLTDGTCKCGLECPLILPKVFNFDPGVVVKQRTAEDVKADEDVTKLCIHKRKLIAVATLHKSMELPPPTVMLTSPGRGTSVNSMNPAAPPRAIRSKIHEGQPECKNSFKVMAAGQQHFSPELCNPHHRDVYPGYPRQRLSSCEPGPKSPYRTGYGSMLSPPSQSFGDGSLSPRTDAIGSPDGILHNNLCGFQGTSSPSTTHSSSRLPLSSSGVMMHGSPAAQSSRIMSGRTNMPLSPPVPNKSPVMKKPLCNYPPNMDSSRTVFNHKALSAPAPPLPLPPPPPCALQNKQVSFEKDPLGILDPIPSKSNPSTFQPNSHSQVPMMNVNIPPAIVPLPSNLPLPTVKPGPVGHGGHMQRTQHAVVTSISPLPVTSPVHMSGPLLSRLEVSPQRSRSSSTSSEQGSFAIPPCVTMKVPPRSPRSSMSSPRPAMPSSPSGKPDSLHQYKEMPNQLLVGMSSTINSQQNPMYSSASGNNIPQKEHPGLLGMPLNQILNQRNAASFPASSLLSAAAKAQLANQNKVGGSSGGCVGGVSTGSSAGSSAGLTCPRSGDDASRTVEGHNALNPMLPPNSAMMMPSSEVQSGRAALRDKLMAQQRDPLRKRKLPSNTGNHENNFFNMLKPDLAGMKTRCPSAEQIRKTSRLPPNTSMAQLLQSLSNHSSHMARGRNPGLIGPNRMHTGERAVPSGSTPQSMQVQQRIHSQAEAMLCSGVESVQSQFSGTMNHMQATAMENCGPMNQSGQVPVGNHMMGHVNSHFHQHSQPNISCMLPSSSDACCSQPMTDSGDPASLSCIGNALQMDGTATGHMYHQQLHPALQRMHGVSIYQSQGHSFPTAPFTDNNAPNSQSLSCLYQDYQGCMSDSSQPSMTSHSGDTGIYQDGLQKLQGQGDVSMAGAVGQSSVESVDAIYQTVVDAAGKGIEVTITNGVSSSMQACPVPALSAMSAFTASIGQSLSLPNAVIRTPCSSKGMDLLAQPQRARMQLPNHTHRSSEQGKNKSDGAEVHEYFRFPSAATPRLQWNQPNHANWRGEEFLECSTQVHSSPCSSKGERISIMESMCSTETPQTQNAADSQTDESGNLRFNNRTTSTISEPVEPTERCAQLNGMLSRGGYGESLTGDDQSPGSSTSLEGPLLKDYTHFNGHFNGHCAPSPSDTKSLSSEEELRHPDSPSADLLHYRPRAFNMGELVWPIKSFPSWPNKLIGEEHGHNPSMQLSEQAKVEPEQLKTLTQDLQTLDRVSKKNRKAGKLNHHLEAAIHEAMSELDKISGTVHQDHQVKLPKPKRRKISR